MKKQKRQFSLALAILLIIGALITGCGASKDIPSATTNAAAQSSATAVETTVTTPSEPVELNYYYPATAQPDKILVDAEINKILLEKCNVKLEIKEVDWGQWFTKYPLLLASGEKVDMIFSSSWAGYFDEVKKKSFLPLDDLISTVGSKIPPVMVSGYMEAAKVEGVTYGIPVNKDVGQGWGVMYNKDMADKIGADMTGIKYIDDLEPVLKLAKEKLPKDVTPIFNGTNMGIGNILMWTKENVDTGYVNGIKYCGVAGWGVYNADTNTIKPFYEIPGIVNAYKMARRWYTEGYINKDSAITQAVDTDVFKSQKAFIIVCAYGPMQNNNAKAAYNFNIDCIEIQPGTTGIGYLTGAMACLPNACSNPEAAMKVISEFWTNPDLMNLFSYGISGKHYIDKGNNMIALPDGVAADKVGYAPGNSWEFGNVYNLKVWDKCDPDMYVQLKEYSENLYQRWKNSAALNFEMDLESIKNEVATINNINSEFDVTLKYGILDTDATIKKIKAKFEDKKNIVDKIYAECLKQIEASKK